MLVAGVEKQLGILGLLDERAGGVDVAVVDEERVRVHRVHLDRYAVGPGGAELRDRNGGVEQQCSLRSRPGLRQLLRGEYAEREPAVHEPVGEPLDRPYSALDHLAEADLPGMAHPFLHGVEGAALEQIRRMHGMASQIISINRWSSCRRWSGESVVDERDEPRQGGPVAEFTRENLAGSRFEDVYLTDARFHDVDLTNARFRLVDLTGVMIRGAALVNVDISGDIENLRVNGVDVVPLVEAELNRRNPERVKMRPTDADGFREAWDILERLWQETVERARELAPELLHERVDEEWSFIETLRHLVFATDAWVRRAILSEPSPWDPLDLPHDDMPDLPGVPRDRAVRPSLDEVLVLRADRMATVRRVIADLTDEKLAGKTEPVMEPGYPESESFAVRRCLGAIINEEWAHRLYAERDLDVLRARS